MGTCIKAVSYYLPEKVLDNAELVKEFGNWTEQKILSKTGIVERHVVTDEITSELSAKAGENLFREHGIDRSEIDFLIICTECPDHFLPATACIVQNMLGLRKDIGAYDMNLGCSGFIYGLANAKGLISAGIAKKVLLITADTITRTIHPMDKSTRTLFGDAAAATLVEQCDTEGIGEFVVGTDGSGKDKLIVPAGAWAQPSCEATREEKTNRWGNVRTLENLYMDGPEVLNFTKQIVPELINQTLSKNGLTLDELQYVVCHQASFMVLENLRDELNIPNEKFFINIQHKGNTTSSTIPLALRDMQGKLKKGDKILILGFGVGLSWGGSVITWG